MTLQLPMAAIAVMLVIAAAQPTASKELPEEELQVEGRSIRSRLRNIWEFFFGEGDDYDYADYNNYLHPSAGEASSYNWYDPSTPRRDSEITDDEDEYSFGEFALGAAMAIIPIGLLMAAFPAGLFTVAVKKRSFGNDNILENIDPSELPLLRSLQEGNLLSIVRPQCQKKLFCEISQLGKHESASFLQRTFYYISHLIPDNISRRLRLQRLFDATRHNQCERFLCSTGSSSTQDSPSNHLAPPTKNEEKE